MPQDAFDGNSQLRSWFGAVSEEIVPGGFDDTDQGRTEVFLGVAALVFGLADVLNFAHGLFLSVGAVSGEIDSGTLHALLARPIRRAEFILGRWLAFAGIMAFLAADFVRTYQGLEPKTDPKWLQQMLAQAKDEEVVVVAGVDDQPERFAGRHQTPDRRRGLVRGGVIVAAPFGAVHPRPRIERLLERPVSAELGYVDADALLAFARTRLAPYKVPKDVYRVSKP